MKILILGALLFAPATAKAELGLGAGGVGFGGFGALVCWQNDGSRWRFGAEYGSVGSTSRGAGGAAIRKERTAMGGIFVHRQLGPRMDGWYASAALLSWRRREEAAAGDVAEDSDLSPYLGLGWWRRFGGRWFADVGVSASPWARLDTPTSAGAGTSRGAADLHAVLGARFW